jgi:ATP adenylyltransferase
MEIRNHKNVWAPWRINYLKGFKDEDFSKTISKDHCFMCDDLATPQDDKKTLLLWRGVNAFVVFNKYPYTGGHMLIVPNRHVPTLADLDDKTMLEMMHLCRDVQAVLTEVISPMGFNIGVNIGRAGGAGLPGHLHMHVVPRWDGDTNFMTVTSDVRVISQAMDHLYDDLIVTSKKMGLPKGGDA